MKRTWGVVFIALGAILAVWIVYVLFVERLPWFKIGSSGALATALITVGVRWLNEPRSRASVRRSSAEPITMTCPACDLTMRVPAKHAGKVIRCKECREEFRVNDVLEEVMPDDRPRRKKKSADLPMGWIIGIGAPVLVVFGIFIYLMSRGGGGIAAGDMRIVPKNNPNAGKMVTVHTFVLPIRARTAAAAGAMMITLSAPTRTRMVSSEQNYDFAYQFQGAAPQPTEFYYLVAKTADGQCDIPCIGATMASPLVAHFVSEPRGTVEFWFERRTSPVKRERVSNIVSVSWPPNN